MGFSHLWAGQPSTQDNRAFLCLPWINAGRIIIATKVSETATTDEARSSNLRPGKYIVEVEATGFKASFAQTLCESGLAE